MIDFDTDIHVRTVDNEEDQTREVTAKLVLSSFQYAPREVAKNPAAMAVLTRIAKFNLWQAVYGDLHRQLIRLREQIAMELPILPVGAPPALSPLFEIDQILGMIAPPSAAIADLMEQATEENEAPHA